MVETSCRRAGPKFRAGVGALACGALLLLGHLTAATPRAEACAVASREPVVIAGEEALIVWLPSRGIEHFIRTAAFVGARSDFGFVVPTPTRPRFTEAHPQLFERLFALYRQPAPPPGRGSPMGGRRATMGAVRVVAQQQVAGLEATTLAANDSAALNGWLQEHGYPASEALREYFAPYVERGWMMNAFRYDPAQRGARAGFSSRAITLSFRTPRPYFPYAEPQPDADATRGGRPFRVSVLAPYRVEATGATHGATVAFAQPLSRVRVVELLRDTGVSPEELPAEMWLTVFDEPSSIRGTADLYFRRSREQRRVEARLTRRLGVVPHDPLAGLGF